MAALTNVQLQTLKTYIDSQPDLAAIPNNSDGHVAVAALLNAPASPTYWVLRPSLTQSDFQDGPTADGTSMDWASTGGFIARSQGERDAYRTLWSPGSVNPSYPNVRAAVDDIFSGTGTGAVANRAHWRALIRQVVTRGQKIYTTVTTPGVGVAQPPGSSVGARGDVTNPDTLGLDATGNYITSLAAQNVQEARNL